MEWGNAMPNPDVAKAIERAIAKGISQRLTGTLETFVKHEVLRYLRQHGINAIQTPRTTSKIPLAEGRNIRRKIGTLITERIKNGVGESLRFKLSGIQARNSADAINVGELQRMIKKAIQARLGRGW